MGIIQKRRVRKSKRISRLIVKMGLILFGLNMLLSTALFFGIAGIDFVEIAADLGIFSQSFLPLLVLFFFAATCSIVWFRFGQIIRQRFEGQCFAAIVFISLLSIVSLIIVMLLFMFIMQVFSITSAMYGLILFSLYITTLLAVIFEVFILVLGTLSNPLK